MCGAQALLAHRYRGFGPGIPDTLQLLSKWVQEDLTRGAHITQATIQQNELNTSLRRMAQRELEREVNEAFLLPSKGTSAGAKEDMKSGAEQTCLPSGEVDMRCDELRLAMKSILKANQAAEIERAKKNFLAVVEASLEEVGEILKKSSTPVQCGSADVDKKNPRVEESEGLSDEEMKKPLLSVHACITAFQALEPRTLTPDLVDALTNLLLLAQKLPVTMSLLTTYPTVAKSIKNMSKEKDIPQLSSIAAHDLKVGMKKLCDQASSVVVDWKKKIASTRVTSPALSSVDSSVVTDFSVQAASTSIEHSISSAATMDTE